MQKLKNTASNFTSIYNFHEERARGRALFLIASSIITTIANIFITGTFYNGFLTMYGITTSGAGVLSYIPYIASAMALLSPSILPRFKHRKRILLITGALHYTIYIGAITLMPRFVLDPSARLKWFIALTLVANLITAPFSPGSTVWVASYYPKDTEKRSRYFQYQQFIANVLTLVLVLVSSIITDALAGSPNQGRLIIVLRWVSYALIMISTGIQFFIPEPHYEETTRLRLLDVFTKPFSNKKFLKCMLLLFGWTMGNGVNATWMYHLQTNLHFSYTFINLCYTWMSALCNIVLVAHWRKVVSKHSWIKTYGFAMLLLPLADSALFFLQENGAGMLMIISAIHFIANVGLTLGSANMVYMNLKPEEDATPYVAFYTFGNNMCALLSYLFGVWLTGLTGDTPILWHGLKIYSVQFGWFIRATTALICGLVATLKWRSFSPDSEIKRVAEIEALSAKK